MASLKEVLDGPLPPVYCGYFKNEWRSVTVFEFLLGSSDRFRIELSDKALYSMSKEEALEFIGSMFNEYVSSMKAEVPLPKELMKDLEMADSSTREDIVRDALRGKPEHSVLGTDTTQMLHMTTNLAIINTMGSHFNFANTMTADRSWR